jgi:putative glutamine amidotransferase
MTKRILVVPAVRKIHDEIYYCVDKNWYKFLNYVYDKPEIQISFKIIKKPDVIILSGGNDILKISKKKQDKIREKINKDLLKYSMINNIKLIGICAGAQFVANKFGTKLIKLKNHIGYHKLNLSKNLINKIPTIKNTNSFHNYGINKISKQFTPIGFADDNTVELFIHNKYKILGIMWHPERYKKFRVFDKKIFLQNLWI